MSKMSYEDGNTVMKKADSIESLVYEKYCFDKKSRLFIIEHHDEQNVWDEIFQYDSDDLTCENYGDIFNTEYIYQNGLLIEQIWIGTVTYPNIYKYTYEFF